MLLRKAAMMTAHELHVRYDQAWQPGAAMPDLYGLATACVAAQLNSYNLARSARACHMPNLAGFRLHG